MTAARNGSADDIKWLVAAVVNVNDTNNNGGTSLMIAEDRGHHKISELMRKRLELLTQLMRLLETDEIPLAEATPLAGKSSAAAAAMPPAPPLVTQGSG